MKRLIALLTALACLLGMSFAYAAQDYTVAEKLMKQLWAGSGFSGTLSLSRTAPEGTPALTTSRPIEVDVDYIYVRETEEEPAQHRADFTLRDGEDALSAAYVQIRDGVLALQADVISPDWYAFDAAQPAQGAAAEALAGLESGLSHTGVPALSGALLTFGAALADCDDLDQIADPYLTRIDVWLEGYRQDAVLDKLEDGTTTMSVQYLLPAAAIKAQVKQMIVNLFADEQALSALQQSLGDEMSQRYLHPGLQPWYFEVVDALPLNGDMTLSRTLTLKGDTLNMHLSLPLYDPQTGAAALTYDRVQGEGDLPDDQVICLSNSTQALEIHYQTYSSMTGVNVVRGTVERLMASSDESPMGVAFTFKEETAESKDVQDRDVYEHALSLTLAPADTIGNVLSFAEREITLDSRFVSKPLKSAATEVEALLTITDGQAATAIAFTGASRKKWEPEEIAPERIFVSELTSQDASAILGGAGLNLLALLADWIVLPQ